MADNSGRHDDPGLLARLGRTRAAMRATMVVERMWPLALPLVIVIGLFLSVSWLGIFRIVPDWARLAIVGLFGIAALAALYPLRLFAAPSPAAVDRRIERVNHLEHAPVLTQTDTLSTVSDDPFAEALWHEHRKRMADRLDRLSGDLPRTRVPERDPWGARAAVALLLVVAFAFSWGPLGGSFVDGFRSHARGEAIPVRIDAWVTPPAYTGRAPLYLTADANQQSQAFRVPFGSDVAVRVTGGSGKETLTWLDAYTGEEQAIAPAEGLSPAAPAEQPSQSRAVPRQFAGKLSADGMLMLRSGEEEVKRWAFTVIPDAPPVIRFAEEPTRAVNGALELRYEIEDDYGPTEAEAVFEQAEVPAEGARPLYDAPEMPLALPSRNGRDIVAQTSTNLTEHPWAGSLVKLRLVVRDAAGQESASEAKTFILPERPFFNPLAKALVEQRRLLALDANAKRHVLNLMDAVTLRPEDTFDNLSPYLGIMAARTRLAMADSDDELRDVVDFLWEIALTIEDGALSEAEKRLRQAQEALSQALENGASDEEIERLMAELREAMQEFMRELAERAMQNPEMSAQMPPEGQELRRSDLERMLDQIEELAKSGAREQAQQMLSQLQDMMNNLQMGRRQQQAQGQGQGQQSQMRQQMDELGEMMRRQQEMMNETFRMDQMQPGQQGQQGQNQQGQQGQGQQGQQGQGQQGQGSMTPEEFAEAMRRLQEGQGQLQQDLEAFSRELEGMGLQPGEGFGDAGEAMGRAEGALGEQQGERAVGEQGQALEALRRGAQDMMQQMQQAMQQGDQGGTGQGGRQQSSDRDPLGRPRATTGPDFGDTVDVPDEIDVQRAREILEQIRRRLGNALSPAIEREYLERLLELQ